MLQFVFTTRRFTIKSSTEETRGLTYLEEGERKMSFPDKLVTFSRSLVIAIFRMKPFQITVAYRFGILGWGIVKTILV